MFVVNDRKETEQPPEMGVFAVISHSMLSALGITTVFLGPLPMIFAQLRLEQPWPRVTALFGAVLALAVLRAPVGPVLATFIFGLVVAEAVAAGDGFWKLLIKTVCLAGGLGALGLLAAARMDGVSALPYWGQVVDGVVTQMKAAVTADATFQWDAVRAVLFYEGPFLLLSGAILSFWLSVGVAAHLGWFEEKHALSAQSLRRLRLPVWVSAVFVGLFIVTAQAGAGGAGYWGGVFRLLGSLIFIQGCVALSNLMEIRQVAPRVRTFVYLVSIVLGFYALVGMGVVGPWLFRKRLRPSAVLPRKLEEGT
jgi:hypothetical protein